MTVEDLCERWGVKPATIHEHVRAGRLNYVDVSPTGIDWSKRGPKQIAFTLAQVEDFERERARGFRHRRAEQGTAPPAGAWTGKSRLGGTKKGKASKSGSAGPA